MDLEGRCFFSVCESRALTGNHSRGGCVYEGIHHNIVYLRASFSHTWITGIAHWQRHTLSLTNRRNTQSFPTSTPQKHTYTSGYTSAFPHCFHTPPRHTASYAPLSHTLSAHTNLAFCYSLSWSSSSSTRQADRQDTVSRTEECGVVVVVILCWEDWSSLDGGDRHLIRLSLALSLLWSTRWLAACPHTEGQKREERTEKEGEVKACIRSGGEERLERRGDKEKNCNGKKGGRGRWNEEDGRREQRRGN